MTCRHAIPVTGFRRQHLNARFQAVDRLYKPPNLWWNDELLPHGGETCDEAHDLEKEGTLGEKPKMSDQSATSNGLITD